MIPHRHARGLSLIEALVALVILVFALAGIVELFLNSQTQSRRNGQRLEMSLLAQQRMEELKGAGFAALEAYFAAAPKDNGAAWHPASPVEVGPRGGVWAISRIESAGPRAFRVTVGLTRDGAAAPAAVVGAKGDFVLTGTVEGGAQ